MQKVAFRGTLTAGFEEHSVIQRSAQVFQGSPDIAVINEVRSGSAFTVDNEISIIWKPELPNIFSLMPVQKLQLA